MTQSQILTIIAAYETAFPDGPPTPTEALEYEANLTLAEVRIVRTYQFIKRTIPTPLAASPRPGRGSHFSQLSEAEQLAHLEKLEAGL